MDFLSRKLLSPVSLHGLGSITILVVLGVVGVTYYIIVLFNYGRAFIDGDLDSLIALLVPVLFHSLNKMDGMESVPDWSSLFPDLLAEIAVKLCIFEDFTVFRGVCTSWRAAAT